MLPSTVEQPCEIYSDICAEVIQNVTPLRSIVLESVLQTVHLLKSGCSRAYFHRKRFRITVLQNHREYRSL